MLEQLVGGPAAALTAVALVVGPDARASGWGARAAVELATRWRGPRRVLLADLDLERPSLHEVARVPNEEGVIDLVDYGVSLGRLIRSAGGGAYDLLTAGPFTPDAGAILRHDDWTRVLLEVAARRATLLAFVPAGADGIDAVVERAGAVLVLAEGDEGRAVVESLPHPYAVLAILTPEGVPDPTPVAAAAPAWMAGAAAAPMSDDASASMAGAAAAPVSDDVSASMADAAAAPMSDDASAPPGVAEPAPAMADAGSTDVAMADADTAAAGPAFAVAGADAALAAPEAPSETPAPPSPEASVPSAFDVARSGDDAFERIRLPQDPAARDALILELRDRQRAARLAGAAPAGPAVPARQAPRPGPPEPQRPGAAEPAAVRRAAPKRPRYSRPLLWTLAVVLLASLLAGAWHFLGDRLLPAAAPAPAPAAGPPFPAAPVMQNALPFVVAIEAHRELQTALTRVLDLTEIEPQLRFHVEPLMRDGVLFHHVMAGPVQDSATALALRDRLIARGHKTGPTPTDVRATPLAYLIGDYATQVAAHEQREVLRRYDVPAYVLEAVAADGQPLYRLYAGGFVSRAEAYAVMGQTLRAAGIRDSLVTRTGSITRTDSIIP